ncbi:metalloregulator ArsR/SmtB family transcription factor [Alicyclobacillus fodiniaquatilis]|uniref:Metalloregulator ArsR/SmtB family transcription factor n=1 Tax=Alicyclobacillus fodiniaquatilis TaxID=1661150 RepID=A0ABW4JFD2_9BACL
MQLDKLVNYHKALADPTRIRILFLLKKGPLHGQALAGKLGVSAPTITHHIAKLRAAGVIDERRDKNTIFFSLNETLFKQNALAVYERFFKSSQEGETNMEEQEKLRHAVIRNFFTLEGRLVQIPSQRKKKLIVFEHLLRELQVGKKYPEAEINQYIERFHSDYCTIRREFIINHYMYRENGIYELNPPEMWVDWRKL